MTPAVVVSSHTMGLGVIRALGSMGVPVTVAYYDDKDFGYVSKYVNQTVRVSHPERREDQFIDRLIELGQQLEGGVLIPTSDASLAAVSRHKPLLEQHFLVGCTEWEVTRRFLDKKLNHALAESADVPGPKTVVPASVEDVEIYSSTVEFPCLVKPCQSHQYYALFHRKMVRVDSLDQMVAAYRQAAEARLEVMLQELIPGDDSEGANYNCYFWDGEPLVEFTAQKVRNAPPRFGSPRVAVSREIPEVLEPGRRILRAMGFYGYACTEFKKDRRDGVYKLMEVNGRHNLSTLLAVRCGINFPWIHYRHLVMGELPSPLPFQTGLYWIDLERDLGYSAGHFWREGQSPWQYLRPYLRPLSASPGEPQSDRRRGA